jgi:flavin-dependent dehydrogenase
VLLVGDAAGLVDPLSGDGMYEAFVSARLAAETSDARGERARRVRPAARAELAARARSARGRRSYALERFPRLVFGVARLPLVWGFARAFLRGDLAHRARRTGSCAPAARLVESASGPQDTSV